MVDVDQQIDAVTRVLHHAEHDGEPAFMQTLTQTFDEPIDGVWRAVTQPDRIGRWFLPVHGDFTVGGRFQLEGHAGGRVLACDPPRDGHAAYTVTWAFEGAPDSWVTITLDAVGDATRLELEHISRARDLPVGMWEQFGPGATGAGWDGACSAWRTPCTRRPRPASATSTPGSSAMRGGGSTDCPPMRGAADVAAGTDPIIAGTRADETYAFYTGQE